jgi:hypothetical protein
MTNAFVIDAVSADTTVAAAVQPEVAQAVAAVATMSMRDRIEALAIEREVWETTVYARSNEQLYALIQKCYGLYLELTTGADVGAKKGSFRDYINTKGYVFKNSTPLTAKIIRCVFGAKDRRRLSTYHTVLRRAATAQWLLEEVPTKIAEFGGVQEISLGKPAGSLTPKQKAEQARGVVLSTVLATVASDKLAAQNNPENAGEQAVAVVTQQADGTYTIHCVVHGDTLVNTALAGYFGANKAQLEQLQREMLTSQSQASLEVSIANAGAAANAVAIAQSA